MFFYLSSSLLQIVFDKLFSPSVFIYSSVLIVPLSYGFNDSDYPFIVGDSYI